MFFEGTEKKIELIVRGANLRQKPESFWHAVVEASNAKILSSIRNEHCNSYLLSESSLFVWDERMTMITCGTTTLVKSLDYILDHIPAEQVDFLTYERKNEYYPDQQHTDFFKDVELLNKRLKGRVFRFGDEGEPHLFLYHLDKDFKPSGVDCTLEVLMHDLEPEALKDVRGISRLDEILPGYQIDDHVFDPCGYSLNAIKGDEYYTIHVTPEQSNSYVSFETNARLGDRGLAVIRTVVERFKPRAFDLIYFHSEKDMKPLDLPPFRQRSFYQESLMCGFKVGFAHFAKGGAQ